jgi:acyl-CoA oxidase
MRYYFIFYFSAGKTSNFATVMAKLIIDDKDHGIHGFVVQLRSLEDHKVLPGLEIGKK